MEQEMTPAAPSERARHWIVGLDIAKEKFDVALMMTGGKWRTKVIANNQRGFDEFRAWLGKFEITCAHICMEATGAYWEALATYLVDQGFEVSVVNPAQTKAYGEAVGVRSKTDPVDAKVIAQFCHDRSPQLWRPASKNVRRLRALVARRESLVDLKTQESNRLEGAVTDEVRGSIEQVMAHLEMQIKQIEKQIRSDINDDPTLKDQKQLLLSVPGIGDTTAAMLLSHYGGELRFGNSDQAVAFAGLDVRKYESGSSVRGKPRLSKHGHSAIRGGLYMPSVVAMTSTAWGKAFSARLLAAGKPKMLILGALMRKMLSIAYGILKCGKPFDPALHA